jgi:hypothetical protein
MGSMALNQGASEGQTKTNEGYLQFDFLLIIKH